MKPTAAKPSRPARRGMGDVYRLCRMLHAYLSAFAFVSLIFFSVTGVLLNHPDWLGARPPESTAQVLLSQAEIEAATQSDDAAAALGAALRQRTQVLGAYRSGEIFDGEALLQFQGPRGSTNATVRLETGAAEVATQPAPVAGFLNDLHTGKDTGAVWRAVIDVSAAVFILLSLIGYVLFFSLRFRLRTSLILTAASIAAMVALAWLFVG